MLERRLKLGRYFGIELYVHWTFALLIGYVALVASDGGLPAMAYGVLRLLGVFLCVTMHEYGHALTARRFGVGTVDITLLPIGGVARLLRMPRVPWQELLVAVAGPAVNVVIALVLAIGLFAFGGVQLLRGAPIASETFDLNDLLMDPSFLGFVISMLIINTMLVLFNMVPAFPMDGGRVLRSVLAMLMDYRLATRIASRVGLVCAFLMGYFGFTQGAIMLVLIAAFIAYAGISEARQVEVMESVRGLSIEDAMIRFPASAAMETPVGELARRWQSIPSTVLPVVSAADTVVGVVRLEDVAKAVSDGYATGLTTGEIADHSADVITLTDDLETFMLRSGRRSRQIPVVSPEGRLVGILDFDSMAARSHLLPATAPVPGRLLDPSFDTLH